MDLDTLLKEAKAIAKEPKSRKKKASALDIVKQTKAQLRAITIARCVPTAIVLRITYQDCACGHTLESVNNVPLVRRVSPVLTHLEACPDLTEFDHLPRTVEHVTIKVPYCGECINATEWVELEPYQPPEVPIL